MANKQKFPGWGNLPTFKSDNEAVRFLQRFGDLRFLETAPLDPTCHMYMFTSHDGIDHRKVDIWEDGSTHVAR